MQQRDEKAWLKVLAVLLPSFVGVVAGLRYLVITIFWGAQRAADTTAALLSVLYLLLWACALAVGVWLKSRRILIGFSIFWLLSLVAVIVLLQTAPAGQQYSNAIVEYIVLVVYSFFATFLLYPSAGLLAVSSNPTAVYLLPAILFTLAGAAACTYLYIQTQKSKGKAGSAPRS